VAPGIHQVTQFIEKPTRERAEALLAAGKYLWNGGMFIFRASVMKAAIAEHLPALAAGLDKIDEAAARGDEARVLTEVFPSLPSISIDHGVMEKAKRIAVVPGDFGWNDVGSWQVTWEMSQKDASGNAVPEGSVMVDARDNLVRDLTSSARTAPKRWALIGVSDLVVVETDDAVLIVPRERAQDVRAVVDALAKRGETGRI
jgi:mannose-1-phosphate guanylyltransferase